MNSARDLRVQADKVELALQERINEMHAIRAKLEIDLKEVTKNNSLPISFTKISSSSACVKSLTWRS